MYDVLNDVETLTNVNTKYLLKLADAGIYSLNSAIAEAVNSGESYVEADIGIGTLVIKVEDNYIQYKFIPSKRLESTVRDTVINKNNTLERKLEVSLKGRLSKVYKDLL